VHSLFLRHGVYIEYVCTGVIVHVNLSPGKHRLGGSALAQCYGQLGNCAPDLDDPRLLVKAFNITQSLIQGTALPCCLVDMTAERPR